MQMEVISRIAENKSHTFWSLVLSIVGPVLLAAGVWVCNAWITTQAPSTAVVSLYITPLAKIIPGYSFNPGYPSIVVSLNEFRTKSSGLPYIVSYPSHWEEAEAADTSVDGSVTYMVKMKDSDIYVVAYQRAPTFDAPVYYLKTAFNPQGKSFFSVVSEVSYQALSWSIVLMLAGAIMAGIGVWMTIDLFLPYYKRTFL